MNTETASNFINSMVRNLQVLCHSNVDFNENVEIIGHIYLSVDKCKKFNYIVNERVCKNDNSSTVFVSNSFHADQQKKENEAKNLRSGSSPDSETEEADIKPKRLSESSNNNYSYQNQSANTHNKRNLPQSNLSDLSASYHKQRRLSYHRQDNRLNPSLQTNNQGNKSIHASDQSPYSSPLTNIATATKTEDQTESFSIDLTSIKDEPKEECNESFEAISWNETHIDHQLHGNQYNRHNISSSGNFLASNEDVLRIYPVAMHSNETQSGLDALAQISSGSVITQPLSGDDSADQHMQVIPADLFHVRRRMELSLCDKIRLIQSSQATPKPSQTDLAEQFGISQPTASNIIRKKDYYIELYYKKKLDNKSDKLDVNQ